MLLLFPFRKHSLSFSARLRVSDNFSAICLSPVFPFLVFREWTSNFTSWDCNWFNSLWSHMGIRSLSSISLNSSLQYRRMKSHSCFDIHCARLSWPSIRHRSDGHDPSVSGQMNDKPIDGFLLAIRKLSTKKLQIKLLPLWEALCKALWPLELMILKSDPDWKSQLRLSVDPAPWALHNTALQPKLFNVCISHPLLCKNLVSEVAGVDQCKIFTHTSNKM